VLLTRTTFYVVLFRAIYVFCLLAVLVRLYAVPVQVIDWKDSYALMATLNPTHSLTHSLTFTRLFNKTYV